MENEYTAGCGREMCISQCQLLLCRTESLLAGRFQKFSKGRTSGEAALSALNEERAAFLVRGC